MYLVARMIMNAAQVYTRRGISTSLVLRDSRSLMKLKKLQADYQCEDGRPIFLKAGLRDRVLYSLTLILCAVGVLGVLNTLYQNAKPSSWKTDAVC